MTNERDHGYFKLRKDGMTYFSKVFASGFGVKERLRFAYKVISGTDSALFGEIEGALCLRVDGNARKTQVAAIVSQDNKRVRRLSLQTFMTRNNKEFGEHLVTTEMSEFTFRPDEFEKLLTFLKEIEFVDFSNQERFQLEDISSQPGRKTIIDASDRGLLEGLKSMEGAEREKLVASLKGALTSDEINILLGRKGGLEEFSLQLDKQEWDEPNWQDFFEREHWVFGYGLDYRIMRQFDREPTVGSGGADNRNRPSSDFLMTFTEYTVLVEIKLPNTPIFKSRKSGRAGTWEFTADFVSAISQVLEQQAEWQVSGTVGEHYRRDGRERLHARTKKPKTILVIGSTSEFSKTDNVRDREIMLDTFELFRRECRSIDIVTFDELYERAKFIVRREARQQ